ncbi:MAG: hypothetical protein SOZ24_09950 [Treponema sp.]|nr:hypothetical protein [Treponema sp.]
MPGLKQLQKFNTDILSLGNEATLRSSRGEKPLTVPIPKSVKDIDDSDDFVLGLPEVEPEQIQEVSQNTDDEDFSDIMGTSSPKTSPEIEKKPSLDFSSILSGVAPESVSNEEPDLSMFMEPVDEEVQETVEEPEEIPLSDLSLDDLLNSEGFDGSTGEAKDETEELNAIENEPLENIFSSEQESDANSSSIDKPSDTKSSETSSPIDTLLSGFENGKDSSLQNLQPAEELKNQTEDVSQNSESIPDSLLPQDSSDSLNLNQASSSSDFERPDFTLEDSNKSDLQAQDSLFQNPFPSEFEDLNFDESLPTKEDLEDDFVLPEESDFEKSLSGEDLDSIIEKTGSFSLDDLSPESQGSNENVSSDDFSIPSVVENPPEEKPSQSESQDFSIPQSKEDVQDENKNSQDFDGIDFSLDNIEEYNPSSEDSKEDAFAEQKSASQEISDFDLDSSLEPVSESQENLSSDFDLPKETSGDLEPKDISSGTEFTDAALSDNAFDISSSDLDEIVLDDKNPDFNLSDDNFDVSALESEFSPDISESKQETEPEPLELAPEESDFDSFENLADDSSLEELKPSEDEKIESFDTSGIENFDFDIPETDSQIKESQDFAFGSSDDFALDNGDFEIPGYSDVDIVQENKNGKIKVPVKNDDSPKEKNTLSDEEYKRFLKNLSSYPLNVRIAVEELIVKDEFTDDAEFEIVQKVLKKVSARQLASELEKMLDISLPVPRDFERRSAEEYEAYKSSFQYQLKNKIIPGTFIAAVAGAFLYLITIFAIYGIYRPVKANSVYKEGYLLLQNDEFPQAEQKFNFAGKYKKIKKWYYKYSDLFRDKKQYLRAEKIYKKTLEDFNFDKKAGLNYAKMMLYEQENYEKAEEIVKRDVLEHHINDNDAYLLLGDIYLEWGTEKEPSKLEDAFAVYSDLIQRNGANDVYRGRQMKYYVRTDKLEQVLMLKPNFMAREKSLDSSGWTELSGYCLDKLYGPLPPKDEYLRSKIEDVKEMLERAVRADKKNPEALYNLSRYYIQVNSVNAAKSTLKNSIDAYKVKSVRKRKDIYNEIDAHRLLGEQYVFEKSFLDAEEIYSRGLKIFSEEHSASGLEANKNIGKLYADQGDIDYFVKGNMDFALQNYMDSIDSGNDTPHIRYKVGYIQYGKENYSEALGSFLKTGELYSEDTNLLFAMGNAFFKQGNFYAGEGYFKQLLDILEEEKSNRRLLFPQSKLSDFSFVDLYMKASNNYGVLLFNLAKRTGDSTKNGEALAQFQKSLVAWDSISRNQETMKRLEGSNLAEQNIKYISKPLSKYEPALYTEISKTLTDEKGLVK